MPICLLAEPEMAIPFLLIESLLMAVFLTLDVLAFYLCFESVLIPLFYLIGKYQGRSRRLSAALSLYLFTLGGSLLMLIGIGFLYLEASSTNLQLLLSVPLNHHYQLLLFVAFFFAFAIKVPMVPFHLWLPEAHVESPTGGSILLAGVLLKLGAYGFLRFSLPLFPFGAQYFQPFIATLSVLGILYAGLTALRQVDIKKIIAYSSVAHMGLCVLGIFSNNLVALEGAIHMLIAHGLVSGALFFCVGSLYSRSHTRLVQYYRGLTQVMPLFSTAFFFFTLANIAFPGSANFIAEFLLFAGILEQNPFITVLASLSILISAAYSLWLYNRVAFGKVTPYIAQFNDLTHMEGFVLFVLAVPTLVLGIQPNLLLELIHMSSLSLLY